ncbi:hypothetical protein [Croceicoccus bisphenolivorans]|uniref:hypothetical protein n=1 Tax=Croceicoccus bisphenolivorans TaxID=1783232 RepID=UPI00082C3510|nr:hypothetical protein [Croceicoccus bisphenolivorans]
MKKIILPALATVAALGLAACDGGEPAGTAEDTAAVDTAASAETGADTAMTEPVAGGAAADTSDTVTISEDGVTADINGSDTSVSADIDGDPSMTVKTD